MFDPSAFSALDRQSGRITLTVVNFLGFFVQDIQAGGDIVGILVATPGEIRPSGPTVGPGANFLQKVILVR